MKKSSRLSLNLYRALMRDARVLDKEPAMKFLLVREDTSYTPGPQSDAERSKEAVLSAQMMEKYQTDVLGPTIHYHPAYACSSIAGVVRKHFKTNKHVPSKVAERAIDSGFMALKKLNNCIFQAGQLGIEAKKGAEQQTPSKRFDLQMADDLTGGVVLVAHPKLGDTMFYKSIVLLHQYHPAHGALGLIINDPLPYSVQDWSKSNQLSNKWEHFWPNRIFLGGPVQEQNDDLFWLYNSKLTTGREVLPNLYQGVGVGPLIANQAQPPEGEEEAEEENEREDEGEESEPQTEQQQQHATGTEEHTTSRRRRHHRKKKGAKKASHHQSDNSEGSDVRIDMKKLRFYANYCSWVPKQLESEILRGDWFVVHVPPDILLSDFVEAKESELKTTTTTTTTTTPTTTPEEGEKEKVQEKQTKALDPKKRYLMKAGYWKDIVTSLPGEYAHASKIPDTILTTTPAT